MQNSAAATKGVELVLGGVRSGKSRHAEALVEASGLSHVYLATATAGDTEMAARIAEHRSRRDAAWQTVEEPLDIASEIRSRSHPTTAILVDCLTLWLTNLMLADHNIDEAVETLLTALSDATGLVVLVSNEVGLGIVPIDPMSRAFTDHAGRLHQTIAAAADRVTFIAAGLPLHLKS